MNKDEKLVPMSSFEDDSNTKDGVCDLATLVQKEKEQYKDQMVNKRIDFDQKTMKRLNTMLPLYTDEASVNKESELYSYVVREAVNVLFEGEFKKKLDEL